MGHSLVSPVINGKLQGPLTFLLVSFCQYSKSVVALGSICFWMALPCKCILLTKVIRADQADINTKDLGDCFGVQVGMVWCLGIKKTRELGLHY